MQEDALYRAAVRTIQETEKRVNRRFWLSFYYESLSSFAWWHRREIWKWFLGRWQEERRDIRPAFGNESFFSTHFPHRLFGLRVFGCNFVLHVVSSKEVKIPVRYSHRIGEI